jgi:tRNA threonylcarbamoyladenosine modification (KEOPS) complex  Pcc1 subunit
VGHTILTLQNLTCEIKVKLVDKPPKIIHSIFNGLNNYDTNVKLSVDKDSDNAEILKISLSVNDISEARAIINTYLRYIYISYSALIASL